MGDITDNKYQKNPAHFGKPGGREMDSSYTESGLVADLAEVVARWSPFNCGKIAEAILKEFDVSKRPVGSRT